MRKNFPLAAIVLLLLVFFIILASNAQNRQGVQLLKEFRPIGGVRNNLLHPELNAVPGSAEIALTPLKLNRTAGAEPNPRTISNLIAGGEGGNGDDSQTPDPVASAWLYVFGQFVDHDLSLETSAPAGPRFDIVIPPGDPFFPGGSLILMTRDQKDPRTHTAVNTTAGYLDLSQLYGSDDKFAASLRNADGTMKSSHDGEALPIINDSFVSGDPRVGENPEISAVTTVFMREHNYWVRELRTQHATWTGDQLYLMAKAITTAEYQNIIYKEYLPLLIGPVLGPYQGYDPRLSAQVTQEFTTAAFRVGHSQISETQSGIDNDGNVVYSQSLAQAFYNTPEETIKNGINALLRNVTAEFAQATDVYAVPVLRNLLFAPLPGGNVDQVDLIAIDVQRGRDVGLGTLNETRKALGLAPYTSFAQLSYDPMLRTHFEAVYGDIDKVDLFMGGQAEDHMAGAAVGETFQAIIRKQFHALRTGDRFYWERQGFDDATAAMIGKTTLGQILRRTTDTVRVPEQVFRAEGVAPRRKPNAPAAPIDRHHRLDRPITIN